jgi:iron-sulfur cluster assembly protein
MSFTLTESAIAKINSLLNERNDVPNNVRIGLRSGGCKGIEQIIEIGVPEVKEDHLYDCNDFRVYVDKKSQILLTGVKIEWRATLSESRFVFHFPDNKTSCSCGKSFSL